VIGKVQAIFSIPELKRRILFTLLLLAVYRIGAHIPVPGVDAGALESFFAGKEGTILGFFNMFSGGALERMTIFALGIMPYISASIILQLLTVVVPHLERLQKEGELGRKKITQYTRYGTVLLSVIQGTGISIGLESMRSPTGMLIVASPGWSFRLLTILTLTAGTAFIMWLGEQITERGIGNGISLIIFAGILAGFPTAVLNTGRLVRTGELKPFLVLALVVMMMAVVAAIIFMEGSHRRIRVQYAKRVVGRKMYGGQSTFLPLRMNTSGVIPPIFASSIIMFPATVAQFAPYAWMNAISNALVPGAFMYSVLYVVMIYFFCYFYTAVIFNPVDVADNIKKYGGVVERFRPGRRTAEHIDRTLSRLTFIGATYLSAVCILPTLLIRYLNVPFFFGGTSLLIVVGVALDTVQQVESHLVMRDYEGFMRRGGRLRGRR